MSVSPEITYRGLEKMENFTMEEMKELARLNGECCISIYMPTDPTAATTDEQRIRFKNLLRRAEHHVRDNAYKNKQLDEQLAEGRRLLENDYFWRHQSDGLTVFITPGTFAHYRLPERFDEIFETGNRLYLKPLIPLFMADGRFYILALSQGEIRLLECTRHHAMPLESGNTPVSMAASLGYDSKQTQLQYHTGTAEGSVEGGGNRPAMFHGQGVSIDDHKDEIQRFFQDVDRGLKSALKDRQAPMVLAAVDYLVPIFQKVTTYPNLISAAVTGNPEGLSVEQLHAKALEIVGPVLENGQREAERQYHELIGKGYTASGVHTVVPAAAHGRVASLFVALDERRPGLFDREQNEVLVSTTDGPSVEDLLDLAAVETIIHGGSVYALKRDRLPEPHAAVAAVLRY